MELTALPGHGGEDGLPGGGHARVSIADDELHAMQAAGDKGGKELAPMHLGPPRTIFGQI
jgi:hypothetical protein